MKNKDQFFDKYFFQGLKSQKDVPYFSLMPKSKNPVDALIDLYKTLNDEQKLIFMDELKKAYQRKKEEAFLKSMENDPFKLK